MASPLAAETTAAAAMTPRPFRVVRRVRETADTWTLSLEPASGEPLRIAPGQFTMLYAFGAGEVPISSSGDPRRPGRLVHTVRAVGGVTRTICATRPGGVLGVRGPCGNAWPLERAEGGDLVLVGGGIGLAPLRGAVYRAIANRRRYRRVLLLYGARSPDELLYARELERWRGRGVDVAVTVDSAPAGWPGRVGVVTTLFDRFALEPASTTALVCGPEIMMRFAAKGLGERGVPPERVHVSLERNMQCGVGLCGHCQLGTTLVCRDGPVYPWSEVEPLLAVREL
jgi:NAD(P)H-flavin reductase